ncbi:MAG: cupin domain-containing protein, partial [Candidatus Sericytochromatia bacterium]
MSNRPFIRNLDEVELKPWGHGEKFKARHAKISQQIGGKKLGYGVVVLPPGKRAWPYHAHLANEEMFYVLEGEGTVRLNGEELPIRAGDFISVPPGPESAHQIINSSETELKYIAVSTREQPEVVQYPDSGKTAFMAV